MRNKMTFRTPWLVIVALLTAACSHTLQGDRDPASPAEAPVARSAHDAPAVIQVRVLLVSHAGAEGAAPDQQRSRAEASERAKMLADMARGGEPLSTLVTSYTDRPGVSEDMGVVKVSPAAPGTPPLLDPAVMARALSLNVGTTSDPIETPAGFVIVERMPDPDAGPERIRAKHILIAYAGSPQDIGGTRSEGDARSLAAEIVAKARAEGADWDALARQYTEEPGGKERAGDLGEFGRGQMVPAFERAAFALDVGEISDVVQSPFGFHVIRRY